MPNPDRSAEGLDNALRARGIALRRMASPAYANYLRITIGFEHELRRTLDLIRAYMAKQI